jgi:hypothetical protein
VVSLTVGTGQYISNASLINDNASVNYCDGIPLGDKITFTGCNVPITTTNTQFKVKLTSKNQSLIPVGTYSINGTVTSFSATNNVIGTDSGSSVLMIKNAAPTPTLTTYTNTTETTLNYSASCTTWGARIGGGSGFRQSITITGTNFGTDPGVGNRSTGTNNIKVGTHQIADTNVTSWSATSITFLTDSSITGDTDADWGTNFGGATALTVTANSQVSSGLNFYIYPQITSVSTPSVSDSAREYAGGDSDGIITLNGTRFGTTIGSGGVSILGQTGTITSWSDTSITVQIPTTISDTLNTGNLIITQGTDTNAKTNTYLNTFRILPRITSLTPSSGSVSDAITISGNHFCQTGTCPTSFSTSNRATFTSGVPATVFTSWSASSIVTAVPTGTVTGNIFVTSSPYTSNNFLYTIASPIPLDPTSIGQFKDSGFTQSITTGGGINTTPIYLNLTSQTAVSGGTLYPQVEYKPVGTAFTCSGTGVCASAVEGTGVAGPGPVILSKSISPTDGSYHFQVRVRHSKSGTDYYSNWVSYGGNAESAADFVLDKTAPVVTNVSSGTPGTNSATITWTTGELSTSQVQWNTTGTFVTDCATNNNCTVIKDVSPMVTSHSVTLSNLNSGVLYYYRVRSKDSSGNEIIDNNNSFTTQTETHPAKTIKEFINGATGTVSSASTYYFSVDAPEISVNVKNAYVEVLGIVSGGFSGTISLEVNGAGARAYDVSTASGRPTLYRFVYGISTPNSETQLNLNDEMPCTNGHGGGATCNKVTVTPSSGSINVLSTKIITTYSYTL